MKSVIAIIMFCVCGLCSMHAEIVREGTNFRVEQVKQQGVDLPTYYTYTDKDGKIYTIYRSKNGSYYIKKVSKKTGNEYKQYLPKKVQEELKLLNA